MGSCSRAALSAASIVAAIILESVLTSLSVQAKFKDDLPVVTKNERASVALNSSMSSIASKNLMRS